MEDGLPHTLQENVIDNTGRPQLHSLHASQDSVLAPGPVPRLQPFNFFKRFEGTSIPFVILCILIVSCHFVEPLLPDYGVDMTAWCQLHPILPVFFKYLR